MIAAEEIAFLPCYLLAALAGLHGLAGIVFGLALADLAVGVFAWWAVARRLHWRRLGLSREHGWWGRPRADLARQVIAYGMRGQLGGLITLLNLRLDFLFLGALAGPAVLGTYAVASKYAELVRLPGTALTWVTYPRMAAMSAAEAAAHVRRLLGPALAARLPGGGAALPPRRTRAPAALRRRLRLGVRPAQVLLVGMLLSGASGVASGYLYGRGRPGLNSLGLGLGLVATVALDLALIPAYGALGAAVASSAAYLLGDAVLVFFVLRRSAAPEQPTRSGNGRPGGVVVTRLRRTGLAVALLTALAPCASQRPAVGAEDRQPVRRPPSASPPRDRRPARGRVGRCRVRGRARRGPARRPRSRSPRRGLRPGSPHPTPTSGRPHSCAPATCGSGSRSTWSPVARRADHVPARRAAHGGARPVPGGRLQGRRRARLPRRPDHEGAGARLPARHPLRAARVAPRAQVLVDAMVPELGCLRDYGSFGATCARNTRATSPGASIDTVSTYLRAGLVDRLDLSVGLLSASAYQIAA